MESTAEAAIRVYAVLAALPNVGADPDRAAGRVRLARRRPDVDDPRLALATEELRLEGDEALDVRLVPVRYRDVPGPRYAGQAASGMPLQEAILRMTPDPTPSSRQDADTDGFTERSLQAERGGVDVTATERPPEPLPHDHGPGPRRPPRARARPPARRAAGTSSSTRSGTTAPAATSPTGAWCGSAARSRSGPTGGTGAR